MIFGMGQLKHAVNFDSEPLTICSGTLFATQSPLAATSFLILKHPHAATARFPATIAEDQSMTNKQHK